MVNTQRMAPLSAHAMEAVGQSWQCTMSGRRGRRLRYSMAASQKNLNLREGQGGREGGSACSLGSLLRTGCIGFQTTCTKG